jgi:hypothetical protein
MHLDLDSGLLTLTKEDGSSARYRRFAVTGEPGGLQQITLGSSDSSLFMSPLAHLEVFPSTIIVRHDPPHAVARWQNPLFRRGRVYFQYLLDSTCWKAVPVPAD